MQFATSSAKLYKYRNNLSNELRNSLSKLMKLTKKNEIVICKSDKDSKILIVDFCDYISAMNTQFANFDK